jgi:thiamine phosphate synthase YjbQ (UPF0047 family)
MAAITTIEYEQGLIRDFPRTLERVAPKDAGYEHQKMPVDFFALKIPPPRP